MPKKTFELSEEKGALLVVQVKNNQKSLCKQIQHECAIEKPIDVYDGGFEKAHGRLERRIYEVFDASKMLLKWKGDWPYIRRIIKVTRTREILKKGSLPSLEISYYVTNSYDKKAQGYAHVIRSHWAIENKNNYVRDTAFGEDHSIRRVNPYIFSRLIDIAKNIMSIAHNGNFKENIQFNSMDFMKLLDKYSKLLG